MVALIALGAAAVVSFGIVAFQKVRTAHRPVVVAKTPSRFPVLLGAGQWEIYQLTATVQRHSLGPLSYQDLNQNGIDLGQTTVFVDAPGGSPVSLQSRYDPTDDVDTYRTRSEIYTGLWSFDVADPGTYSITVTMPRPGQVVIARPSVTTSRSLQWALPAVFGAVLLIAGLIGFFRDRERRSQFTSPIGVGPGWRSSADT